MDDERLKNGGTVLTKDYFKEQLERIREIRLSERRFYQKITDIYATSIDYDAKAQTTRGRNTSRIGQKFFFAQAKHTLKLLCPVFHCHGNFFFGSQYATSIDYDAKAQTTRLFFARVQNQLHWAIHGETASRLNYNDWCYSFFRQQQLFEIFE